MQKIPFNLRTDRYFLYYNEEMQKLINKLENDEETILLDGGLML